MRADDPNLPDLRLIADALGNLRDQLVFVGGAVAGLLVTDPLSDPVRATRDVDAIINASRATFYRVENAVARLGFIRDVHSEVICRWIHASSGIPFDLMPVEPEVLGFSNRWYPFAVETAQPLDLGAGVVIRVVSAVAFVATKLEAFVGRGGGDIFGSHDLEDVLNIVNGRLELPDEVGHAPEDVRAAISERVIQLTQNADFLNALPGLLAEPDRYEVVLERLGRLTWQRA